MKSRRTMQTTSDPIVRFQRWYGQARRKGAPQPEAMALGTVASNGLPSVRFVLLKQVNRDGFVFFTDSRSRKGANSRQPNTLQQRSTGNSWANRFVSKGK